MNYGIVQDNEGGVNEENGLAELYANVSKKIYQNVKNVHGEDIITGMDFGREDPDGMYRQYFYAWRNGIHNFNPSDNAYNLGYKTMQNLAGFLHDNGKKFLWIPYSTFDFEWERIGQIVNTGKDSSGRALLDVFMMQPGLFYSDYDKSLDDTDDEHMKKQIRLRNSVLQQAFVDDNNQIICGENTTQTNIAFQIEYDISLITGRNYNKDIIDINDDNYQIPKNTYPKQAAQNFVKTYIWYKDLIYNENVSIGIKDYLDMDNNIVIYTPNK